MPTSNSFRAGLGQAPPRLARKRSRARQGVLIRSPARSDLGRTPAPHRVTHPAANATSIASCGPAHVQLEICVTTPHDLPLCLYPAWGLARPSPAYCATLPRTQRARSVAAADCWLEIASRNRPRRPRMRINTVHRPNWSSYSGRISTYALHSLPKRPREPPTSQPA